MALQVTRTTVKNILTRTSGYLETVSSHSLQPYRGCSFGNTLCGVGCYVQHNRYVTEGRPWGSFLEVRENAAASYLESVERERRWARAKRESFSIFLSSSTDPFVPQEKSLGATRKTLEAMREEPPDVLILQTHSPDVAEHLDILVGISKQTDLRVHVTIETDRDRLPGLPPPPSSIDRRFEALRRLRADGIRTVVTVSPLLPLSDPDSFFRRIAECADAVVLDHFIGGDGSPTGWRTLRTELPAAMEQLDPDSVRLDYRDRMAEVARRHLPHRVGIGVDGFAGRFC